MAQDVEIRPANEAHRSFPARHLRAAGRLVRKILRVGADAGQRFFADGCSQHAAGIAYRVLFSTAPLAIVIVSIFGLVLQDDSVRHDVVNTIVDALPVSIAGRKDVEDALDAIATPASAVGLISLLVFVWAATGMMAAIRGGLEAALGGTESRPAVHAKLVDLALVVGAAVLVLLTAGLTVIGHRVESGSVPLARVTGIGSGTLAGGFLHLETFVLTVAVVLLLYRFVPSRGLRSRDSLVGAVVTAALMQLITFASGLIYDRVTRYSVIYGSLSAVLVFLYSIYLYSSVLLFGAEVAAAWRRPPETDGPPVGVQLRRGALGLFVKQKPLDPPPESGGSRPGS
jgi:membrane protein